MAGRAARGLPQTPVFVRPTSVLSQLRPGVEPLTMYDILTSQLFPEHVVAPFATRFSIDQGLPGGLLPYGAVRTRGRLQGAAAHQRGSRRRQRDGRRSVAARHRQCRRRLQPHRRRGRDAARGIVVTNTPGVLTDSVADLSMLLVLGTLRRVAEARHATPRQLAGWSRGLVLGHRPARPDARHFRHGRHRAGGRAARRPVRDARDLQQAVAAPTELERELGATFVTFDELIATSDVLSVHVPLNDETRGSIGCDELRRMRRGVFIINAARGPGRRRAALIGARERSGSGRRARRHRQRADVPPALREHPRALILPHIASATHGTRGAMMRTALENAAAVLEGRVPTNAVGSTRVGADRARRAANRPAS